MKDLVYIVIIFILFIGGCMPNSCTRYWGGKQVIDLPKGQKLVEVNWKSTGLWYLTEPMPEDYRPQVRRFREKSNFGWFEGEIQFTEKK